MSASNNHILNNIYIHVVVEVHSQLSFFADNTPNINNNRCGSVQKRVHLYNNIVFKHNSYFKSDYLHT